MSKRILVWDAPTRVFHWLLALSFLVAFVTAESERFRDLHVMAGYTALGLVGFRLLWGFVGTRYARFSSFLFGPAAVARYLAGVLRGAPPHYVGHNPAGGLVIFLLLGMTGLVGLSGLATYNEWGGEWLEEAHEAIANGMLALIGVHVAGALASSLLHKENLPWAMVTGRKRGEPGESIRRPHAWLGALIIAGIAAFWLGYDAAPGGGAGEHDAGDVSSRPASAATPPARLTGNSACAFSSSKTISCSDTPSTPG